MYENIYVARQPVFDRDMNTWAYELLFRHSATAQAAMIIDPEAATLQIIADGIAVALPGVDERRKVLVNFPQSLLLKDVAYALPPKRCVIEVLENTLPTPEVLDACKRLKASGFKLALDDFVGQPGYEPLLELADLVKVDVLQLNREQTAEVVKNLGRFNTILLAEKVEDREVFEHCKSLGFEYFQGYFFSKPVTFEGRRLSSNQVSRLRLITELGQHDFDPQRLSKILQSDVSLSLRLFRFVNSVSFGLRTKCESIKHALVLLGEVQTMEWLRVVLLTDLTTSSGASEEVLYLSALRGRFFELLGLSISSSPLPPDGMFLFGLFSLLDTLVGQPLSELVEPLPIDERIKKGLMEADHPLRAWIDMVEAWERGEWEAAEATIDMLGFEVVDVEKQYARAVEWAQQVLRARDAAA